MKFFSAPNDVIMCSGDKKGCIPIKYFKEIRNIQTGEQIEIKINTTADKTKLDKRLNPLLQNYVPNRPTAVTTFTINDYKEPKAPMTSVKHNTNTRTETSPTRIQHNNNPNTGMSLTPTKNSDNNKTELKHTQYCGEHYNEAHA